MSARYDWNGNLLSGPIVVDGRMIGQRYYNPKVETYVAYDRVALLTHLGFDIVLGRGMPSPKTGLPGEIQIAVDNLAETFETMDDAGVAALIKALGPSVYGYEYGGVIYENPDGSFSYTGPKTDYSQDSINTGYAPDGSIGVSDYHTHGTTTPGYVNDEYSIDDIIGSEELNQPGYLGIPNGGMFKFTPEGRNGRLGPGTIDSLGGDRL